MSRLLKLNLNCKMLFVFSRDQLSEDYFAVVRITWFAAGQICAVNEAVVYQDDLEAVAEFSGIVGEALRGGADVSIVCIANSEDVGLEPA